MKHLPTAAHTRKAHESNIEKVVRLEAEQEKQVELPNRISEAIGRFAGTNIFVALQIGCVLLWVLVNSGVAPGFSPFDPFPFVFLGVLLALEAVLLASFVLIRQNRMSEMADRRSHLDLQISLLAEKEATKVLQCLQRMSRQMGIEEMVTDREARQLSKDTEVEDVARDLQENLKEGAKN
jgi:uncharacterized membrane protein